MHLSGEELAQALTEEAGLGHEERQRQRHSTSPMAYLTCLAEVASAAATAVVEPQVGYREPWA